MTSAACRSTRSPLFPRLLLILYGQVWRERAPRRRPGAWMLLMERRNGERHLLESAPEGKATSMVICLRSKVEAKTMSEKIPKSSHKTADPTVPVLTLSTDRSPTSNHLRGTTVMSVSHVEKDSRLQKASIPMLNLTRMRT